MKFTQFGDFNPKCLNYNIIGSCNGILCLANYVDGFVLLWNPSIRKFKDLPKYRMPKILHFDCKTYGGFGYDPISDNYKVVVILHYYIRDKYRSNYIEKTEVKVHILGTNFWKNIREFPCGGIPREKNGHFVSGTINWLASKNSSWENTKIEMLRGRGPPSFILSFNLENESYQEILLPGHTNIDGSSWHLGVLRNCLCMINGDDVWIMKEHGNKDSWTKMFTIPYFQDPRTSYSFVKLINIFEDYIDESIEGKWTWKSIVYEFKNDIIKLTEFESTPAVCVESLIAP
ncbi:F-box/kelch-repeat protein At3g23880-like [Trifolium pratense]|uniref:F-box/kelch-repeat protein At3g23880-like n=1 Tax=Trifolium pratense TaxID=57577 RepID=UPI001E696924|nr:F-box/kelch-repeat protein At3g23880-like [Trifolium pratense]